MRSRIGTVKKSTILAVTRYLFLAIFVILAVLNIFLISLPAFWFYAFCTLIGIYETLKSRFFKLDSAFYFGSLTFLVGISGFIFSYTNTAHLAALYVLADFFFASLLTFWICGQKFHLVFAYLLLFAFIFTSLYLFSLISLLNFIAILGGFLVLFIVIVVINLIRG